MNHSTFIDQNVTRSTLSSNKKCTRYILPKTTVDPLSNFFCNVLYTVLGFMLLTRILKDVLKKKLCLKTLNVM